MNRIYRLCWNRALSQWVPASELANATRSGAGPRKRSVTGQRALAVSALTFSLVAAGLAHAGNGPTGGQIVAGAGQIQQVGNTTTIRQDSQTLSLNWQSFNIGSDQTVNFLQPGSSAIAVNRIFSSTPSAIYGHLNANGQVWLINPNGILFGPDAQVNVGGLVASTLDLDDDSNDPNTRHFSGSGKGSIINRGSLSAADGGYVALLGNQVSNQGVITAQLGTVALGGGSAVTLTFAGNQLLHLQVDQSTLNNLAENRQLIIADGGRVIMTAGARDSLLASVVNNSGVVQAQTVQNRNGTITLLGGMQAGTVNVGGTLDASAPNGGSGGAIETSAAHFNVAANAQITAAAPHGEAGTWLVDPTNLTIDSTAATTISNTLNGGTSVTEQTTASGASGVGTQSSGAGDIDVNAAVTWNSSATLTLQAYNAINVNAAVNGGGAGKVVMDAGGANLTLASGASITGGGGITLATAANFVNNAGSAALNAGSANWLVYSTNPTLDTTGGLTPTFIQYNAPYPTAAAASGNGLLYSVAPTLAVSGLSGSVSKTYDGGTSATLAASNLTTSGLINGDIIASATGSYASANAGSNIAVSAPSSISSFNITSSAGIPIYGYALSGSASANIGTINPGQLTASIVGDPTKVYDGTTTATLTSSNYQISGFVAGQSATVNQPSSVAYAGADAGSQAVNASFTITNFVAGSGTNLSNYILPTSATGMGTITQAPVLLSGLLATSKVYDGTTADTLDTSNVSIYGVISQDSGNVTLSPTYGTGTFASANAGNGIAVSVSGFSLTGSKASDYQLIAPANLTANITPKALTVSGVTATDKVYDGSTAATLNVGSATLNGVVGGDSVALLTGSATGTFSQSDVGSNLSVTASGLSLAGASDGNYTLTQPTGLTANITPRPLTVSFNGSPAKIYDGTDAATLTSGDFTISGFVSGQSAVVSQSPAIYASSNAGSNIGVTATLQPSDFTPGSGTSLSNYSFNSSVTGTGTINPAPLVISIVNNPTKVYDGTTDATLTSANYTLSGVINGQSITFNGPTAGTYDSANAGIEGVSATLTAADFTQGSGTLLSNYALPTLASGYGTITPRAVGVSIVASVNDNPTRVYDGTTAITLAPSDFTLTGFVNGDSATVNTNITGTFASKNVGSQPLTATLQESNFNFSGSDESNYTFPVTAYGTGTITPAPLTVSIIGNPTKVYDGSTVAQLTSGNFQINGFVSGEGATLTPTASFNYTTANAGSNIAINGTLTANNYTATGGTLLSNYTLASSASGLGNITQAPLFVTGVYATNKVYDTTTSDTLNVSAAGLAGLVASDSGNVTLNTSTSGTFAQSNVGNGIGVTASGFSISGSAANNYLLQPISGLAADITPKAVTISGVSASNKVYDAGTSDMLNTGSATLNGVFASDSSNVTLSASGAAGTFSTANVGNNLSVSTSGFTLSGSQSSNYSLTQPGGLTADITPATLTAVITGSPTKVYDGTNSATLTASDYTLTGFVSGQGASIPQSATANYTTANAGTGLGVQSTLVVSDFVANSGTLLSNYILPTSASGNNGVITPYVLNLSGTRVYDANTDAMGSLFGTITGLNGDKFTLSGQGSSSSKNVGTYVGTGATSGSQPFNLGSLALVASGGSGTDLPGNYTLIGGADTLVITPATLTVTGTTVNTKTYDGSTSATLSGTQALQGVFSGDTVTIATDTGSFSSPNAGTNIPVSAAITLGGTDAGNYILTQPSGLTGTIAQAVINLSGTRQYDAGTDAQASAFGSSGVISTGVDGQTLSVTGTGSVSSANVGSYTQAGSTFQLGTLALANGSGLASNYTLGTSNTFAITPYVLNLSGTRVYDTTTNADASLFGSSGTLTGVNGETLTLSGTGTVSSKNVGTYTGTGSASGSQGFNLNTLALGNGTGTASNYTLMGGADTLTITKAALTISGTTVNTKTYDGTTNATLGGTQTLNNVLSGDTVTIASDVGSFASPNVGTNIAVTSAITLGGADAGNYTLTQPTGLTGDIIPAVINLSGTRQYDAGTDASASAFGSNGVINTGIGGQTLTVTGMGSVTSQNVNSYTQAGATFNLGSLALTNGSGQASNYTLGTSNTFAITPYVLSLTGSRAYDGTTAANASLFGGGTLTGVNGETLTLSGAGTVSSANASATAYTGTGATSGSQGFNLNTLTLSNGTGTASNYTLIGGADSLTINKAVIDLSGTRQYDAGTDAKANAFGTNGVINTGVGSQTLTVTGTGSVSGSNVGGYTVSLGTLALTNGSGSASNYTLSGGSDSLAITPYMITLAGTRPYDAGTDANASAFGSSGVINTGVGGQTLTVTGMGSVSSQNVNSYSQAGATFNLGSLALTNDSGLASNYQLSNSNTFAITPYVLNLSGARAYDATTGANANLFGGGTLTGVNGETLTLSGAGAVSSANVGSYTGANFNLNTLSLTNGTGSASNYTLVGGTDMLTINPAVINLSGTRQYDASNDAAASTFGNNGVINTGVNGQTLTLSGAGMVTSGVNVGTYSGGSFNLNTLALNNDTGLASNYTLTGGADSFTITPYVLNLSATRVYDAGADANANLFGNNGTLNGVNGETLTLSGSGTVSSKNVGTYTGTSQFNLNTLSLTGNGSALASNYTLIGGTDTLAIAPYVLTVIDTVAADKTYDGNTHAALTGATLSGVFGGDNVTLGNDSTGTFATPNAGSNIGVSTAMTISGGDSGNYVLQQPASLTATINPYVLNLSGTRVYDANNDADAGLFGTNGVLTGINGDTLTLGGSGTVSSKNVGTYTGASQFGLNTLSLTGNGSALAGNYTLAGGTDTLTITPATLTVTGTVVGSKTYDGTTTAQLSDATLSGVLGSDNVTLGNAGTGTFASPNAGTGIAVSTGMTISGGDAGNYVLVQPSGLSGTINPYVLNLSGTRVYDANTDADAGLFGSNGVLTGINGDTLTLSGSGTVSSKNVGTYSGTSQFNLNTLSLTGNGSALAGNYTLAGGTDTLTITPATLTIIGTIAADKTYDGTSTAQLSGAQLQGVLGGDNVTLGNDSAGTFATPNAGNNIAVGTSMTVSGGDAGNYVLVQPTGITATINPYVLNLSGTRAYDANTDADAGLFGSNGVLTGINGDTLKLSGSGTVSSKNVGAYTGTSQFNLNTLSLTGNGSALASNYTLAGGTDTLTITPYVLTVIDTVAADKTYDGTSNAVLSGATLSGVFGGDNVTLGNATAGTFVSPNAGSNIGVNTAMTISGVDSGNYILQQPTNLAATINPYVLNLIATRVYDGMTDANANLFGSSGVLTGVNGETVDLSGAGVLASKQVGTQSFAGLGTLALSNGTGWASNYTLVGGTDHLTVTPLAITVSATGQNKTYDANTTAGVTLASNGVLAGDTVNFSDGAAHFSTPNAGNNVAIAVTGITATGADAGDYSFNTTATTSATINPYVLNLTGTRVYDGTTGANASLFGNQGVLTGVNGETVDLSGSGVLTSKNVGAQRAFADTGSLVLGNGTGLASNYTLAGGTDWVSITPATLTVIDTATTNRVYDGTTVDALNGATLSGVFGNDNVVLGNDTTGLFGDKNVGNGKTVATAMTISGADAGNYILLQPTGLTADITPLPILVTATGANRMYDGKVDDAVKLATNGVLAGDQVSLAYGSASFANPYVGNGKPVTVSGIVAAGGDAGNYLIEDPVTTTTANITSAGFAGSGVQGSWIAQMQAGLQPISVATPYGSSDMDAVGVFTGNQQLRHRPIERNRARSDFRSGLSLQLQNGGVRLPSDASP